MPRSLNEAAFMAELLNHWRRTYGYFMPLLFWRLLNLQQRVHWHCYDVSVVWLWVYQSELCVCVFDFECESHICMMCDLHSPHHKPSHIFTAMLLCCGSVVLYIMKWGNTDLLLALKSMCCNGALVSAFSLITWHMLRLCASKTQSLSLAGRCDGAVKEDE